MNKTQHYAVLLVEAVAALVTNTSGCYVDGTFGRGGHSREILQKLSPKGRLLAFDKDPLAISEGEALAREDARFSICHQSFVTLDQALQGRGITEIDGVLLDLGVSSPQLDEAERGFSFLRDGPLDMRMNTTVGNTATEWLNQASEGDIARVLKDYGEERFAKRIARSIVAQRQLAVIERTAQLAEIVAAANPAWERDKHPATRVFQAIRIFINNELQDLENALPKVVSAVRGGGRIVIISFHSLEDRIVKRFFRDQARGQDLPKGLPVMDSQIQRAVRIVGKPVKASQRELAENIRSRSAVMRVAEKLPAPEV